jgi:hypothetical protein
LILRKRRNRRHGDRRGQENGHSKGHSAVTRCGESQCHRQSLDAEKPAAKQQYVKDP